MQTEQVAWHQVTQQTHFKAKPGKAAKPRPVAVWQMDYRLASGKQSSKVLARVWSKASRPPAGFMTEAQAIVAAQKFMDEYATVVPDDRRTFGRGGQDFLDYCITERELNGSTLHEYVRLIGVLGQRPWKDELTWADRPLESFRETDLVALRTELAKAGRSPETLNHYRRVIRGAFGREFYGRWVLPGNSPAHAWAFKAVKADAEGTLRFYTPEQLDLLMGASRDEQDLAIWTLATEAGPRQSEIRALIVRNVDFANSLIIIDRGYTTRGGKGGTKSHKLRSVPMSDNTRAVLEPFCAGKDGDTLVFEHPQQPGEHMCGMMMYRRLRTAAKRAGIPVLRFHDLRHTYGTIAVRTLKIEVLQQYMGHAKIETTLRYTHFAGDPEGSAKISAMFTPRHAAASEPASNVVPLRKAS